MDVYEIITTSYLALLRIPHTVMARHQALSALVACRDWIADYEGRDGELVQNDYEARAEKPNLDTRDYLRGYTDAELDRAVKHLAALGEKQLEQKAQ